MLAESDFSDNIYIIIGGKIMEKQDWEMSVEEFNDCGCAMNGD